MCLGCLSFLFLSSSNSLNLEVAIDLGEGGGNKTPHNMPQNASYFKLKTIRAQETQKEPKLTA